MLELTSLPVGDPDRLRARNALVAALSASSLFVVFAVISTQNKDVRVHSPWQDDPFDVVVSFTMFLVPMLMAALLVRAQLCRTALPLPTRRFNDLLRCARAALAAVGLTTATDWSAAVLGEHRSQWGPEGRALLGMLGLVTFASAAAAFVLRRVRPVEAEAPGPDWVEDVLLFARFGSARLGRFAPAAGWLVGRGAAALLHPRLGIRRHPVGWALLAAAAFGLSLSVAQGVGEHAFTTAGSTVRVVATFGLIGTAGIFVLFVGAGRYLRAVAPVNGTIRHSPAIVAGITAAVSVPVTVAFRSELPWVTDNLLGLIAVVATASGVAALAATSLIGRHGR
jgi:hypothetical protein